MSVDVLSAVFKHSRAEGTHRCVLLALADTASHDGVAWTRIGSGKDDPDPKTIARRANASKATVIRALHDLEKLGEVEVRKAQRGRARINVYRIVVGSIGRREVEYDRLPFELDRPFGRGLNMTPRQKGDEVSSAQRRGVKSDVDGVSNPSPTRARVSRPYGAEPSLEPSVKPSNESYALVPAAAGEEGDPEQLRWALTAELGCKPRTRSEHGAWGSAIGELVEVGATAAQVTERCAVYRRRWPGAALTPMALVRWWGMLEAAAAALDDTADEARARWVESTSWTLDPEDAHWIVDQWAGLSDAERAGYHRHVVAVLAAREEEVA